MMTTMTEMSRAGEKTGSIRQIASRFFLLVYRKYFLCIFRKSLYSTHIVIGLGGTIGSIIII